MCSFSEGYSLENVNSIKITDLMPLLTLVGVVSERLCKIARPLI